MPVYTYNQETIEIMTSIEDLTIADMDRPEVALRLRVEVIDDLIAKAIPMPDLEDPAAVRHYFERAHEVALPQLKEFVRARCESYLEDLK